MFKKLKPKYIFVSNNFRFGNKREGNVSKLKFLEKYYPDYEYKRSLIINGGEKGNLRKVEFQLDNKFNLNCKDKVNFSF